MCLELIKEYEYLEQQTRVCIVDDSLQNNWIRVLIWLYGDACLVVVVIFQKDVRKY